MKIYSSIVFYGGLFVNNCKLESKITVVLYHIPPSPLSHLPGRGCRSFFLVIVHYNKIGSLLFTNIMWDQNNLKFCRPEMYRRSCLSVTFVLRYCLVFWLDVLEKYLLEFFSRFRSSLSSAKEQRIVGSASKHRSLVQRYLCPMSFRCLSSAPPSALVHLRRRWVVCFPIFFVFFRQNIADRSCSVTEVPMETWFLCTRRLFFLNFVWSAPDFLSSIFGL